MTNYRYKARNAQGQVVEGVLAADSDNDVAIKLEQMGCMPLTITAAKGGGPVQKNLLEYFNKIGPVEVNMFSRQLFTLQKAGLPLLRSLGALKEQTENKSFQEVLTVMMKDIEDGATFSTALERFPRIFSKLYISMIKSGEVSGRLIDMLERLAVLGQHEEQLRKKIKSSLRYPLIVVSGMVLGFLILVSFVIPRFAKLYSDYGKDLPLPTRVLLGLEYVTSHYWWLVIMGLVGLVFMFRKMLATKNGRYFWDRIKLHVPVFGLLNLQIMMSRYTRIMGMLMSSGIPLLQIFDLVADSTQNVVVVKTINSIKQEVNAGKDMHTPMKQSGLFPPLVTQMVAVGEETGKVEDLMLHIADYYDEQIAYITDNLVGLIEPFLILTLGAAVLFMALGIFLPMWSMMDLFS